MNTELSTAKYFASSRENSLPLDQQPKKKGGWNRYLTAICILFAISSLIGALGAARGFYGLMQPQEKMAVARSAAAREMQKVEQARRDAVNKYYPLLMYSEIVKLFMAGALMFAAVYLVSQAPKARNFALGVCCLAIFFHVTTLIVSILMISETGGVVNSIIGDTVARFQFEDEKQKEAAVNYMQNSMISGITVAIAIAFLIKLIYYGVIMAYLWSDDVKRIFGEDSLAYLEKEAAEDAARSGIPRTA